MTAAEAPRPNYPLHVGLFLLTFLTTTAQGAAYAHGGALTPLADGLTYSIPLMAILVFHEFGHYFAARAHGVHASLPYFIPLPPRLFLLGTMGAVIVQAETDDRRKLIDIGAAGPLAGLVLALPILYYGLLLSQVQVLTGEGLQEGNSILYALMKLAAKGEWLPSADGRDVILHPIAWAGWAGLLVTMLNLLPVGQLDGGHIATAYFGNRYQRAASLVHRGLPVLAVVVLAVVYVGARRDLAAAGDATPGRSALLIAATPAGSWVLWFVLMTLLKRMSGGEYHPPVADDRPLPRSRRVLFWVVCLTFLLIFMPVPLRRSVGKADSSGGGPSPAATAPR